MNNLFDPFGIHNFHGMKIIEAPMRPKMQLAPGDYVTPEFRNEINAWLIEFFGYESDIPKDTAYIFGGNIVMRPEMIAKIQNLTA